MSTAACSVDRDSWCTPKWLADALGHFGLDPCSNPRSHIDATWRIWLEDGVDGLKEDWTGYDVFINGPYSNLYPWAEKAAEAKSVVALVNSDHSTRWFKRFVQSGCYYEFKFDKRIQFEPPPGVKPSTNSKPQSLLCTWNAALRIEKGVKGLGSWWCLRAPSQSDW